MKTLSFHVLRVGTAITFLWIGFLILQTPEAWGGYLQPWAADLLPVPLAQAMFGTALLDIAIGFFLLIHRFTWIAALLGALHILAVLIVSGITDITVRDLAILAGALAITIETLPPALAEKFHLQHLSSPV